MRAVIQRVSRAKVIVDNATIGSIAEGLLVLLGVEEEDDTSDADWLVRKIQNLRIFSDDEGKMNLSVKAVKGNILLISQFTLHASTKKGNRPSFIRAAKPKKAEELYNYTIQQFNHYMSHPVETGSFGADMKIDLLNDGPVTIYMDTKHKE